jgi:tellurite resistance protein TehA-like permease
LRGSDEIDMLAAYSPFQQVLPTTTNLRPVSISLPASPRAFQVARTRVDELQRRYATGHRPADRRVVFPSQPVPAQDKNDSALPPRMEEARTRGRNSYDSFKTWSGKLERQIAHATHLLGSSRPEQEEEETAGNHMPGVQRFFAALEGPELDTLRVLVLPLLLARLQSKLLLWPHACTNQRVRCWQSSEELILLPSDKTWPFLLRFPVSAFGMVLGMSSQAILWKRVAISASTQFLHITVKTNLVLWCVSVALMLVVSALYACKLVLFFEAVRREYYHPIRANFFFAPWIACLFLAIGVPEAVAETLPRWLWYLLMAPILCLELKIYGQWISGGQRRLSRVANPSNHLSVVGNFVGAMLGGIMGLKEGPLLFFAVGLAHYMVLFVTLYQRLPTSETLPRDLHPVFFLFVATPSVACLAWARITGEFDYGSKIAYFIAMFLYASLVSRSQTFIIIYWSRFVHARSAA